MILGINKKTKGSVRSLFVLFAVISLSLFACSSPQASCKEELSALLLGVELPAGETYVFGAEEGDAEYLSPEVARSLYGDSAEDALSLCEDFAIFISARGAPFEAAVFRCYSASDCDRVAEMILSRIGDMQILLRDTEFAGIYDTAGIDIRGRIVTLSGVTQKISK